jgi:hypothetical protein
MNAQGELVPVLNRYNSRLFVLAYTLRKREEFSSMLEMWPTSLISGSFPKRISFLHRAAARGNLDVVKFLLDFGADISDLLDPVLRSVLAEQSRGYVLRGLFQLFEDIERDTSGERIL